jgi:hypothetical protein
LRTAAKGYSGRQSPGDARAIPWQQPINLSLLLTACGSGERVRQVRKRIDGIKFTGLDQRGDGRPILSPSIVTRKERILAIEGYWL